ncbi:MAG: chromosome partition protein MukE [Pseudomonadota bacterium]
MTYQSLEQVIADPLFSRVDLDLRRGRHIGADCDPFMFDFLTTAKPFLDSFYGRYDATLLAREEGYFYLLPDRLAVPPPLGQRKLGAMDMLVGQALALMRLDPKWLESNLRIPQLAVLELLQQILGEERLLRVIPRRRGRDVDQDARKLREAFAASVRSLERQYFIKCEGRGEATLVRPLVAIMRFADPVRTSEELGDALETLIADGQIADGGDDADSDPDA